MDELESIVRLEPQDQRVFEEVDDVVSRSIVVGDPLLAFEHGTALIRTSKVKSYALAKLLYKLNQQWGLFQSGGTDDDLETMAFVHMGVRPATTQKYMRMWESIFENPEIPDDVKKLLMGRNIGDTLLLTAAARDGSLDSVEIKEAAMSPDRLSLRNIIKKKRGDKTSAGRAVRLFVARKDTPYRTAGTVYVKIGDEYENIALLLPVSTDVGEKGQEVLLKNIMEVF